MIAQKRKTASIWIVWLRQHGAVQTAGGLMLVCIGDGRRLCRCGCAEGSQPFAPGCRGGSACRESKGQRPWPSEVLKAKRPEGFDTLYWVLPVETGALRGNESNSAKEISNPTKEKEVTTHRNSKAAGIPSQWPCGKARRLQPQAQRPQLRRGERGEHRSVPNYHEPLLGLRKRPSHP